MQWKLQIKVGYTAKEKRVWRFSVDKNYCIKYIINKVNGQKKRKELHVQSIYL